MIIWNEWEDFSKPKIVFQEIVQESQFFYDMDGRFICNDTCRIIVGKELSFLLGVLNSKLFFPDFVTQKIRIL